MHEIYKSALKFLSPSPLKTTFKMIVKEATRIVGGKYGSIFLAENGQLERVYASSPVHYQVEIRQKGKVFQAYKFKKPYLIDSSALARIHPEFKTLAIKSDFGVPLVYNRASIGVLSVQSTKDKSLIVNQMNRLKLFARIATIAIKNAQLHEDLEKALATRDLFISIAAHELKTPLTSIFIHTQFLLNTVSKGKMPQRAQIGKLLSEEIRVKKLVEELLQITRVETGSLVFEMKNTDIVKTLKRAITTFKYSFPDHIVSFENKVNLRNKFVYGDYDKLLSAFLNILTNAGKFSKKGSKIIAILSNDSTNFTLEIKDEGEGISKKEIPKIFDKYYKEANRSQTGMGLGLYLVKHIIEKHKGNIYFQSHPEAGTTATIVLPKSTNARTTYS